MTRPENRNRAFRAEIGLFLFLLAGGLMLQWWVNKGTPPIRGEPVIRVGIGHDLLAGVPRGRQGLIGSLHWTPLPILVLLPVLRLPPPFGGDWAPVVTAIAAGAFLCALLSAWLGRCGIGRAMRLTAAVALFLSPALQAPMAAGSSAPLLILLAVSSVCFLIHWWETEQLRSLAYLALTLGLAVATRHQAVLLLVGAGAFVAVHLYFRRQRRHYAEATLIVFLVPAAYVLGLWLVSNWLIMGDPFFFVRGLAGRGGSWTNCGRFAQEGGEWRIAFFLCVVAFVTWRVRALARKWRAILSGLTVLAVCVLLGHGVQAAAQRTTEPEEAELRTLVNYLGTAHDEDWIVYAGHRGYELARTFRKTKIKHLHHILSFYPDEVLKSTRGKRAYLLVPAREGDGCWEDINLKYPDIFENGSYFTVFERSWRRWRLLRMVRMDESDRR